MPFTSFPCNFTVEYPSPTPTGGGITGTFTAIAERGADFVNVVLVRTFTTPGSGSATINSALFGVPFLIEAVWASGVATFSITTPQTGWRWRGGLLTVGAAGQLQGFHLAVQADNVSPWSSQTFVSDAVNMNDGSSVQLYTPLPFGEPMWIIGGGSGVDLIYNGYFGTDFLIYGSQSARPRMTKIYCA